MVCDSSICCTRLSLALANSNGTNDQNPLQFPHHQEKNSIKSPPKLDHHHQPLPFLTLGLSNDQASSVALKSDNIAKAGDSSNNLHGASASVSGVSSFSNSSVKREREVSVEQVDEVENLVSSKNIGHRELDLQDEEASHRKKLRLTKEQSLILENSFKEHSTLNPKQKQALAKRLNLRPRQVEVWFQNRRARTKLKQTEVDYEILKKCCETLKEENRRIHKELQEIKAMKLTVPPLFMQIPAATLSMCPSCERISGSGENPSKNISFMPTKPHFYTPFLNPSPTQLLDRA